MNRRLDWFRCSFIQSWEGVSRDKTTGIFERVKVGADHHTSLRMRPHHVIPRLAHLAFLQFVRLDRWGSLTRFLHYSYHYHWSRDHPCSLSLLRDNLSQFIHQNRLEIAFITLYLWDCLVLIHWFSSQSTFSNPEFPSSFNSGCGAILQRFKGLRWSVSALAAKQLCKGNGLRGRMRGEFALAAGRHEFDRLRFKRRDRRIKSHSGCWQQK
jgi:hypothetical protein